MLVTSEINMSSKDLYNAYHQLWQIEESFRIMKSELDTRPVYLHKENRIKGHFFICYTAVLLSRILQFKILENKYSASTIYDFMRKFRVVRINSTRFINLLTSKGFVTDLSKKLNQTITNYYLQRLLYMKICQEKIVCWRLNYNLKIVEQYFWNIEMNMRYYMH